MLKVGDGNFTDLTKNIMSFNLESRFQISDFRKQIAESRFQISESRFQISDYRFQKVDFRFYRKQISCTFAFNSCKYKSLETTSEFRNC